MNARPTRNQRDGPLEGWAFALLLLLLVLPAIALSRLAPAIDWRILTGVPVAISLFTYLSYRSDKRRAEAGEWRIPEATLHLAEVAGGWPGAFLAQRNYRHKTAKLSFQVVFWLIVLLHQLVALDFLMAWKLTKGVLARFD